jgi:hypothetical protein
MIIVIPEDAHDRHADAATEFPRQLTGFLWQTIIREVAAEDQDVGLEPAECGDQGLQRAAGVLAVVKVADGRQPNGVSTADFWY